MRLVLIGTFAKKRQRKKIKNIGNNALSKTFRFLIIPQDETHVLAKYSDMGEMLHAAIIIG